MFITGWWLGSPDLQPVPSRSASPQHCQPAAQPGIIWALNGGIKGPAKSVPESIEEDQHGRDDTANDDTIANELTLHMSGTCMVHRRRGKESVCTQSKGARFEGLVGVIISIWEDDGKARSLDNP